MASFQKDISSAFSTLGKAARRALSGWLVLLPLTALVGGGGHLIMWKAGVYASGQFAETTQQSQLIWSELGKLAIGLFWGVVIYPFLDAASIYVWRAVGRGEAPGFKEAVNWSLNRYGRMFGPHAAAFLSISLGMVIVVPGILFGLMYAFTDAITATDERARRPLARSEKLTKGRRRRIALSWLPYAAWYLPAYLYLVYAAEGQGFLGVLVFGTFDMFLLQVMEMTMFGLYEERIEDARKALEARKAREAEEGGDGGADGDAEPGAEAGA